MTIIIIIIVSSQKNWEWFPVDLHVLFTCSTYIRKHKISFLNRIENFLESIAYYEPYGLHLNQ